MTANGHVRTIPKAMTAAEHVAEAERLLAQVATEPSLCVSEFAVAMCAKAQVHATLAVALADIGIEADEDRIAGCVPDGGSALNVSVRGQR